MFLNLLVMVVTYYIVVTTHNVSCIVGLAIFVKLTLIS